MGLLHRVGRAARASLLGGAAAGVVSCFVGCGGSPARQDFENTFEGDGPDLFVVDDDLVCLGDPRWDLVGRTRIWNALGQQASAVSHGRNRALGEYPIGTVLQLFPEEVSVKRGRGFSQATGDWEFLKLDVQSGETIILERGTTEIGNPGGSCITCHGGANAFDYACFTNGGCGALPPFVDLDVDPDTDDPRCR
jgi:hypothetical protein